MALAFPAMPGAPEHAEALRLQDGDGQRCKLDESQKTLLPYEINEVAHGLITDEVKPNRSLLQKPAVSDGAE